jgi:hypothetical protein
MYGLTMSNHPPLDNGSEIQGLSTRRSLECQRAIMRQYTLSRADLDVRATASRIMPVSATHMNVSGSAAIMTALKLCRIAKVRRDAPEPE